MQKYFYTIACIFLFLFADDYFCQDSISINDTLKVNQKHFDHNDFLFENFLKQNLDNYDSIQISQTIPKILIDSLKYIFELKLITKMALEQVPGLDISNKIIERNKQRALLLLTSREYNKNQPNYDLGKVGKYLGISKRLAVLILAIMSL